MGKEEQIGKVCLQDMPQKVQLCARAVAMGLIEVGILPVYVSVMWPH